MQNAEYRHTQSGPVKFGLLAIALVSAVSAAFVYDGSASPALFGLVVSAATMSLLALSFGQLTVEDNGEFLSISFGPIPLFRKLVSYSEMTAVEPARSSWIDGIGIHYAPGRGWIYNIWGSDCVAIRLGDRQIRIGSDDVDALLAFLRKKIGARV